MAEYVQSPGAQNVAFGQNLLLVDSIPCARGYIIHRNGSGILTLRGIVNGSCGCFARYQVTFNGNIAIPEGGTVTPIAVALAVNGEPRLTSRAIFTPAAVEEYFNVTSTAIITVPRGCCFSLSLRAVAASEDPAVTPAPIINLQNANLDITRIA